MISAIFTLKAFACQFKFLKQKIPFMKKYLFTLLILSTSLIALNSCNNAKTSLKKSKDSTTLIKDESSTSNMNLSSLNNAEDVNKHYIDEKIYNSLPETISGYPMKKLARDCVDTFTTMARNHDQRLLKTITESVSYETKSLRGWLDRMQKADSIKLEMGIYTPEFINAIDSLEKHHIHDDLDSPYHYLDINKKGKTTIFLFAYDKSGNDFMISNNKTGKIEKSSAYNLGNLHP